MSLWVNVLIVASISLASFCAIMLILRIVSPHPVHLGGLGGLHSCSNKPNAVSSADPRPSFHIAPFECTISEESASNLLVILMAGQPRTMLVHRDGPYLHFECRSLIFRFIDDVEFLIDAPHGLIEIRSASRAGHSDIGVNRARMERLRQQWNDLLKAKGPA